MEELFEVADPDPEGDWEPPSYSTPGWMLVEVCRVAREPRPLYRYEVEVLAYDCDSSVFWINEGVGFDWWIDENVDLELPGFYVIEGITGTYYRGTWGVDDDDEEWEFELCRRATDEEVAELMLEGSRA